MGAQTKILEKREILAERPGVSVRAGMDTEAKSFSGVRALTDRVESVDPLEENSDYSVITGVSGKEYRVSSSEQGLLDGLRQPDSVLLVIEREGSHPIYVATTEEGISSRIRRYEP